MLVLTTIAHSFLKIDQVIALENNNKWGRGRGSGEGRGEGAGGSVVNLTGGQTDFYMVDMAQA